MSTNEQTVRHKTEAYDAKNVLNIILAVFVVLAGTIYFLLLRPLMIQMDDVSVQEQSMNETRQVYESQSKPALVEDQQIVNAMGEAPGDEDWGTFFAEIQKNITATGVSVDRFDLDFNTEELKNDLNNNAVVTKQNFTELPFSMAVSGNYQDVINFLSGLNQIKRLVSVGLWDLAVLPSETITDEHQKVQLNLKAKVYTAAGYRDLYDRFMKLKEQKQELRTDPTWSDAQFFDQLKANEKEMKFQ